MNIEMKKTNPELVKRLKCVRAKEYLFGLFASADIEYYEEPRNLIEIIGGKQKGDKK